MWVNARTWRAALALVVAASTLAPGAARAQAGAPADAGLRVDVREQFYALEESTLSEVIARLNATTLEDGSGRLAQGLTDWRIEPTWRPRPAGGSCRVSALTLTVRIVITLPEWRYARGAPPTERERWDRIESAIREHEHTHQNTIS